MRMSCNGCRVLRKACYDDCVIRPCLGWIPTPEAQGNATLFLAKFYGRAGLTNLLSTKPQQQRASIFKSLLYEACGRIVNPVYGSVGLLWSGKWQLCQAAVESVLKGASITKLASATTPASASVVAPIKASDIRHLANRPNYHGGAGGVTDLHKVNARSRVNFKRSGYWSIRSGTGEPRPLDQGGNNNNNNNPIERSWIGQMESVIVKQERDVKARDLGLDLTLGSKFTSDDHDDDDEEEALISSDASDGHDACRVELCLTVRG